MYWGGGEDESGLAPLRDVLAPLVLVLPSKLSSTKEGWKSGNRWDTDAERALVPEGEVGEPPCGL